MASNHDSGLIFAQNTIIPWHQVGEQELKAAREPKVSQARNRQSLVGSVQAEEEADDKAVVLLPGVQVMDATAADSASVVRSGKGLHGVDAAVDGAVDGAAYTAEPATTVGSSVAESAMVGGNAVGTSTGATAFGATGALTSAVVVAGLAGFTAAAIHAVDDKASGGMDAAATAAGGSGALDGIAAAGGHADAQVSVAGSVTANQSGSIPGVDANGSAQNDGSVRSDDLASNDPTNGSGAGHASAEGSDASSSVENDADGNSGGTETGTGVDPVSSSPSPAYPESASQSVTVNRDLPLNFDKELFVGSDASKEPAAIRITQIKETADRNPQESALSYQKNGETVMVEEGDTVLADDLGALSWDTAQNDGGSFSFEAIGADQLRIADAGVQTIEIDETQLVQIDYRFFEALAHAFNGDETVMVPYVQIADIVETDDANGVTDALVLQGRSEALAVGDIIAAADYDKLFWDYSSNNGGEIHWTPLLGDQTPYVRDYSTPLPIRAVKVPDAGDVSSSTILQIESDIGMLIDRQDSMLLV